MFQVVPNMAPFISLQNTIAMNIFKTVLRVPLGVVRHVVDKTAHTNLFAGTLHMHALDAVVNSADV